MVIRTGLEMMAGFMATSLNQPASWECTVGSDKHTRPLSGTHTCTHTYASVPMLAIVYVITQCRPLETKPRARPARKQRSVTPKRRTHDDIINQPSKSATLNLINIRAGIRTRTDANACLHVVRPRFWSSPPTRVLPASRCLSIAFIICGVSLAQHILLTR